MPHEVASWGKPLPEKADEAATEASAEEIKADEEAARAFRRDLIRLATLRELVATCRATEEETAEYLAGIGALVLAQYDIDV